jgi:putative DNA primase/helicase
MMGLSEMARALDGEVVGRQVLAPGPGHSRKDRSLAVWLSDTAPGGFIVHSHAGDDWRTCRDHVADRLGIVRGVAEPDPVEWARQRERQADADRKERQARIGKALALWNTSTDPRGTVVEWYLRSRRLDLSTDIAGSAIRFNPAGAWRDEETGTVVFVPMMVVAMLNIERDDITAVHRTALTPDGQKIGRRMSGIAAGAAIKLDPDASITEALTIGEGIETTLSGRQLGYGPAWAMGSVLSIASFPVLADVRRLSILEEIDESGASARAVEQVGKRWTTAGREVFAIKPTIGNDLNDALRGVAA